MLANIVNKIKYWYQTNKFDIVAIVLIILVVLLGIGIWRLWKVGPQKEPIRIDEPK